MRYLRLQPEDIVISERFRKDYGDIEQLAESILDKGILQPVVVNQHKVLQAGGRRYAAFSKARELDPKSKHLKFIPAVEVQAEGELELREIELYENMYRKEMRWDEKADLMRRIHDLMVERHGDKWSLRKSAELLSVSSGGLIDQVNLAKTFEKFPDLREQPTFDAARRIYKDALETAQIRRAVDEAKDEQRKSGEGKSRLLTDSMPKWEARGGGPKNWLPILDKSYIIGDALEGMANDLEAESFNFAEVDPPYAIDLVEAKQNKGAGIGAYNEILPDDYEKFIERAAKEIYRVLSKDSFAIWWFGPTWFSEVKENLEAVGFHVDPIPAIWHKIDSSVGTNSPDTYMARAYEPFFVLRKGRPVFRKRGRPNVFSFPTVPAGKKIHPTERPIHLIREIYKTFMFPRARVLCPFLGSGNTILACRSMGALDVVGFDRSEIYKDKFLAGAGDNHFFTASPQEYIDAALEEVGKDD